MTHTAVVHYLGATAKSRSVVASLVADLIHAGDDVTVVDISDHTVISQDFPPVWVVRLLGHRLTSPGLPQVLQGLGATLLNPSRARTSAHTSTQTAPKIRPEHQQALDQALESELLTYFRRDSIPDTPEARVLHRRLLAAMEATYGALDALWSKNPPDRILVPNGRTSRQKAARLVAEHHGITVGFYEDGRAMPHSYYLGTTQPHDRLASQGEVESVVAPLGKKKIAELAQSWLRNRMAGENGTNEFSTGWEPTSNTETERDHAHKEHGKKAVFFASSFDEFRAFGPMWLMDSWSHQFEGFDAMMTILEKQGVALELRLHPNLGSKSREYFNREMSDVMDLQARHPGLVVHWHNSSINSYDLVRHADYVIVERSTIGLEASLMGKPVWVTQASQWDQVADIRQMLAPTDVTEDLLQPWRASPLGAQKFVAYWMVQEHPLHYDWSHWSSWNPERAPLRMKIALLATKNPWRHKARLVRIEWTARRNRRFLPPETQHRKPVG